MLVSPNSLAEIYRAEIKAEIEKIGACPTLVGVLASKDASSHTYSQYMKVGCEKVGIGYSEIIVEEGNDLDSIIAKINDDKRIDGAIVYYPIFGGKRDQELREKLSPYKDVEGLHPFWLDKLYGNIREVFVNGQTVKSLLPCTPLAILKLLDSVGEFDSSPRPLLGKTISIFNRSEVVGRPLAFMLSNDGAKVYSFDVNDVILCSGGKIEILKDITREQALFESNIVITGVPNNFKLISTKELIPDAVCLNFSSIENFEQNVQDFARIYIPRVGPVTVAMCLRNLLRMFRVNPS